MKIFAMKPGHDGSIALIDSAAGTLEWSFEAEKDSFPRFEVFNPLQFVGAAEQLGVMPDVFAVSGWGKGSRAANSPIGAGYYGHDSKAVQHHPTQMFGTQVKYFTSSHERSHIWCSYGMSPFEQGKPCYVLVWEGALGDFYEAESVGLSLAGWAGGAAACAWKLMPVSIYLTNTPRRSLHSRT